MIGALSDLAALYLIAGAICTALVRWQVEPGCPWRVVARCAAACALMTPYVCVRHGKWPWTMTMVLERVPR